MFKEKIKIKDTYTLIHLEKVNPRELFNLVTENKEYLSTWMSWTEFTNKVEDTEEFIKESIEMIKKDQVPNYGIYSDSQLIGLVGLNKKDNLNNLANAGYWIDSDFQGRGIITDALKLIISITFTRTDINRIELYAGVENIKSQKIAERCNFTREGIRREGEKIKGTYIDLASYSLLKKEWQQPPAD